MPPATLEENRFRDTGIRVPESSFTSIGNRCSHAPERLAWNSEGLIVFAPSRTEGLFKVPATGGVWVHHGLECSRRSRPSRFPSGRNGGARMCWITSLARVPSCAMDSTAARASLRFGRVVLKVRRASLSITEVACCSTARTLRLRAGKCEW